MLVVGLVVASVCGDMAGLIGASNSPLISNDNLQDLRRVGGGCGPAGAAGSVPVSAYEIAERWNATGMIVRTSAPSPSP